jgi:uncharacterized protein (DUF1810 family)
MSKIAKLISAEVTRPIERTMVIPKFNFASVTSNSTKEYLSFGDCIRYNIGVRLGAQVYITDDISSKMNTEIERATETVRRAVIEEIFGEFRPLINEMSVSLYDRDFDKLKTLIDSLYNQMFIEGLS